MQKSYYGNEEYIIIMWIIGSSNQSSHTGERTRLVDTILCEDSL